MTYTRKHKGGVFCADLKKIYDAVNIDDDEYAKEKFREKWYNKYSDIIKSWDKNWAKLIVFFDISYISFRTVRKSVK